MQHLRLAGFASCHLIILGLFQPVASQSFPLTLNHEFGQTTLERPPERIVSISFIGHDFLLALGVVPIGLRKWYGPDASGVWVWAQDALGSATPFVMQGEIDIEQIALLKPDLIEAQWSGMTEKEYRLLSVIAPTLGPVEGAGPYGSSWEDMTRRLGQATGRAGVAEGIIAALETRFADLRAAHPAWQGATATMAWSGSMGAYTSKDLRGKFLESLGFKVPDALNAMAAGNAYYVSIPAEDYALIDLDVLVWLDTGGSVEKLRDLPLRFTMRAYREGREVYADPLLSAALSHSSPLSLGYALDRMVPLFVDAVDGDPATPVASTQEVGLAP
ncbi:MAG: ABC transporter substrate-binding protein [Pseudomonadota bacterium]